MRRSFGCAVAFSAALIPAVALPAAAAEPVQLGLAPSGQVSFSYVGKIEQNGPIADDFGYLTTIVGLDEAALFTGSDPLSRSESTARFTYFASAQLKTRAVNGNVFATSGTAQTTLYLNEQGGASFDDPVSFKRGTSVATWTSVWHDIVNVQQPNMGVARVESEETQRSAHPFTLGGTQYVLGRIGLLSRLSFTGEGTRTDPTTPRATILYAGEDTLLLQEGIPVAEPAASGGSSAWAFVALGIAAAALVVGAMALAASRLRRPAA